MAIPILLLGYGLGPIPIPALPLALDEITGRGVALWAGLVAAFGLLLVALLAHRAIRPSPEKTGAWGPVRTRQHLGLMAGPEGNEFCVCDGGAG